MSDNFYEQETFPSIELIELAEDVSFSSIHDINAKFFMKLMTPNIDTSKIIENKNGKYQESNYIILPIPGYMLLSFMKPSLGKVVTTDETQAQNDKYVFVFDSNTYTIPKGTKFLVELIGGDLTISKICIVGIYNNPYE